MIATEEAYDLSHPTSEHIPRFPASGFKEGLKASNAVFFYIRVLSAVFNIRDLPTLKRNLSTLKICLSVHLPVWIIIWPICLSVMIHAGLAQLSALEENWLVGLPVCQHIWQ